MRSVIRPYLFFITFVLIVWSIINKTYIFEILFADKIPIITSLSIFFLYTLSHFARLIRLSLLSFEKRENSLSLLFAHNLTAFLSILIPFKIGEFLRFFAFTKVCKSTRKGAAIWLIERLGDILIISLLILFLYVFNINIPQAMQAIFIIFAVTCMFTLFTIFSLSKVVIYLKRNLILTSLSSRSLLILKFSDRFRLFEIEMHKVIEGRIMGFILLSSLIWFFEITSLSIFLNQVETINSNFADIFSNSILGTLSQEEFSQFKIYQYLVLFGLTFTSILILYLRDKFKKDSR